MTQSEITGGEATVAPTVTAAMQQAGERAWAETYEASPDTPYQTMVRNILAAALGVGESLQAKALNDPPEVIAAEFDRLVAHASTKPCQHCDAPPGTAHSSSCPYGVRVDAVARVLVGSDAFCPACGHNRDASSVSSVDHGDGRASCQKCGVMWREVADGVKAGVADQITKGGNHDGRVTNSPGLSAPAAPPDAGVGGTDAAR